MSADALLAAIAAAPHDDAPRQVYADWLDERGRARAAALIRQQCAPGDSVGLDELAAAIDLLPEYAVDAPLGTVTFERGLPSRLRLFSETDAARASEVLADAPRPLDHLSLGLRFASDVRALPAARGLAVIGLEVPALRRYAARAGAGVTSLRCSPRALAAVDVLPALEEIHCVASTRQVLGRPRIDALQGLPALRRLSLYVGGLRLAALGRQTIAGLESLSFRGSWKAVDLERLLGDRLTSLQLTGGRLEAGDLERYLPDLPRIERLDLSSAEHLGDHDLARVVAACPRLRSLTLSGWQALTPAGAEQLGELSDLESLTLFSVDGLDTRKLAAIADVTRLRRLTLLFPEVRLPLGRFDAVEVMEIGGTSLQRLDCDGWPPSLRALTIDTHSEPSDLRALPVSPALDRLRLVRAVEADDLDALAALPSLRWIAAEDAPPETFERLPQLLACETEHGQATRGRPIQRRRWEARIGLPVLF